MRMVSPESADCATAGLAGASGISAAAKAIDKTGRVRIEPFRRTRDRRRPRASASRL